MMEVVSTHLVSSKGSLALLWFVSSLICKLGYPSKLRLGLEASLRSSKALVGVHGSYLLIHIDCHVHSWEHIGLARILTAEAWNTHWLETIGSRHLLLLRHGAIAHLRLSLHACHTLTIHALASESLADASHIHSGSLTILLTWCSDCAEGIESRVFVCGVVYLSEIRVLVVHIIKILYIQGWLRTWVLLAHRMLSSSSLEIREAVILVIHSNCLALAILEITEVIN